MAHIDIILLGKPAPADTPADGPGPEAADVVGVSIGAVVMSPGGTVLPLFETDSERGGAKSSSCSMLLSLARVPQYVEEAKFNAPTGCCIPFGAMEAAVDDAGKRAEFESLIEELEVAEVVCPPNRRVRVLGF